MVKAVIFDFDGTIGDTLPLIINSIRYGVQKHIDHYLSDEEILSNFGPTEEGIVLKFAPNHYEEACEKVFEYYNTHHKELCPKPFDGVMALIQHLKKNNIIVALATGKGKRACDISLKNYKMDNIFDMVETGSDAGAIKPQMMNSIMKHYNLKPEETIYVGDAPTDIDAARQVGVGIVSALYGTTTEDKAVKAKNPDKYCYSIAELTSYLDSIIK